MSPLHAIFLANLLLVSLFGLTSFSQVGARQHSIEEEALRCLDGCSDTDDVREFLACRKDCELRFRKREEEAGEGSREVRPRPRYPPHHRRGEEERPRYGGRGREEVERPRPPGRGREEAERPSPWHEYQACRAHCSAGAHQRGYKEEKLDMCLGRCKEILSARERRRDWEREREVDGNGGDDQCTRKCERYGKGQERQLCRFRCSRRGGPGGKPAFLNNHLLTNYYGGRGRGEGRMNPYYFPADRFRTLYGSREGEVRVLERFDEGSELLKGLKNVRLAVLEADPGTFVLPHHTDADCVFVVLNGNGTINLAWQEKRESYELDQGDVLRVLAGATVYLSNPQGSNQVLRIAKLVLPASIPGSFEEFFLAGSEYPESYFGALSTEVLEASLNTPMEEIRRVFGQQWEGPIIRASGGNMKEKKELEKGKHGGSIKKETHPGSEDQSKEKKGHQSRTGPFNMLKQHPIYSNGFGRFFEASPEDFEQLRDLDISVTFVEVNQGSLMVPHYNSRATTAVLVIGGNGRLEMACPHLAQQRGNLEEEVGVAAQYQNVEAQLCPGDVFVIPPGHPIAIVADRREKLRMVGFRIKARNNRRVFLAGKESMINRMDRWGKEMSFNAPADEIDRVFTNQKESYFVPLDRVGYPSPRTDEGGDEADSQEASPPMDG
ncbi:hypothetical protein MLD38_039612 [Melastoma candidum]|uniref:Uncharacterized protein n=1 Tax=Melastoma candidum TaxID=119954 RepID=A0ACB9L4Z2_9MYRT|nr:hypothetical protein MLD38_039612 [Melastoma candidum]